MNRKDAKIIAETITNEQLLEMFSQAKLFILDWTEVSSVNKSFTKGTAWNILAKDFDIRVTYSRLAKVNMIREFGKFLNPELKPKKKQKPEGNPPIHQNPIF